MRNDPTTLSANLSSQIASRQARAALGRRAIDRRTSSCTNGRIGECSPHSTLARFILLFAFLYAAFGVSSPLFPSFLSARGLEPEAIAVVLAAGTAIRLVAAPLAGRIADRLDASRAVLAASIAGAALLALGIP